MADHVAKIFAGETLHVDGQRFVDCEFRNVVLVFEGGAVPAFTGCTLVDCAWRMDAAAERTLQLRRFLYALGPDHVRRDVDRLIGRT